MRAFCVVLTACLLRISTAAADDDNTDHKDEGNPFAPRLVLGADAYWGNNDIKSFGLRPRADLRIWRIELIGRGMKPFKHDALYRRLELGVFIDFYRHLQWWCPACGGYNEFHQTGQEGDYAIGYVTHTSTHGPHHWTLIRTGPELGIIKAREDTIDTTNVQYADVTSLYGRWRVTAQFSDGRETGRLSFYLQLAWATKYKYEDDLPAPVNVKHEPLGYLVGIEVIKGLRFGGYSVGTEIGFEPVARIDSHWPGWRFFVSMGLAIGV